LFVTTFDLGSQVAARQLDELATTHSPRLNVLAVALEPPSAAPLVETFKTSLGLRYPLVMADPFTLQGEGPFGGVHAVPALFVLDRLGRVAWRRSGVWSRRELDTALRAAETP
jgi:hypothetical protein